MKENRRFVALGFSHPRDGRHRKKSVAGVTRETGQAQQSVGKAASNFLNTKGGILEKKGEG